MPNKPQFSPVWVDILLFFSLYGNVHVCTWALTGLGLILPIHLSANFFYFLFLCLSWQLSQGPQRLIQWYWYKDTLHLWQVILFFRIPPPPPTHSLFISLFHSTSFSHTHTHTLIAPLSLIALQLLVIERCIAGKWALYNMCGGWGVVGVLAAWPGVSLIG